jgi:RHS repeat-associated protein
LAEQRSGTTGYYEQDGLGSVTSLSNSTGALTNTYTYDAFGNLTASTGGLINPFQYTGREWDGESGLYNYRARYYDPSSGRFLGEDPIGFGSGVDFYSYVDNGPTNFTDPHGLRAVPKPVPGKVIPFPKPTSWLGRLFGGLVDFLEPVAGPIGVVLALEGAAGTPGELEFEKTCKEKEKLLNSGHCQVGRWMSPEELAAMQSNNTVQESRLQGVTSVTMPPNPDSYKDAPAGSVFVTFIVPCNRVRKVPGGWGKIYGPNSTIGRGLGVTDMPPAYYIEPLVIK